MPIPTQKNDFLERKDNTRYPVREISLRKTKIRNENHYFCRENCQIHIPVYPSVGSFCLRPSGCSCPIRILTIDFFRYSSPLSAKIKKNTHKKLIDIQSYYCGRIKTDLNNIINIFSLKYQLFVHNLLFKLCNAFEYYLQHNFIVLPTIHLPTEYAIG